MLLKLIKYKIAYIESLSPSLSGKINPL